MLLITRKILLISMSLIFASLISCGDKGGNKGSGSEQNTGKSSEDLIAAPTSAYKFKAQVDSSVKIDSKYLPRNIDALKVTIKVGIQEVETTNYKIKLVTQANSLGKTTYEVEGSAKVSPQVASAEKVILIIRYKSSSSGSFNTIVNELI